MYGRACFAGMICLLASVAAAAPLEDRATIQLWNDKAPGALGDKPEDTPLVQVFIPPQPSTASIVVCPGGGYGGLANHEGPKVGEWLASQGVTAFVLRYRLGPKYHHPVGFGDAQRWIPLGAAKPPEGKLDSQRNRNFG